jgi:hypothetical protein
MYPFGIIGMEKYHLATLASTSLLDEAQIGTNKDLVRCFRNLGTKKTTKKVNFGCHVFFPFFPR